MRPEVDVGDARAPVAGLPGAIHPRMAISSLLRRMGFLKLDAYGLILTPEGRVLATRPAVLDDGLGGKIVGWREGDLAAMELDRWQSPPATPRATADPSAIPARVPPSISTRTVAVPPPVPTRLGSPVAALAAPVLAVTPLGAQHAAILTRLEPQPMIRVDQAPADAQEPLEDEWEWQIAVARARAHAEWAEEAAPPNQVSLHRPVVAAAPAVPPLRVRAHSPTAPIIASPAIADRWDTSDRTKTTTTVAPAPLPRITQPTRPVHVVSPVVQTRTVIPVPMLTQVTDPSQIKPRARIHTGAIPVRPHAAVMSAAPRRFPRATGPTTSTQQTVQQTVQPVGEDTQVTYAPPANDDLTSPGLLLPASTASNAKRAAAKQR
ncbi:hypothetical protein BH11MYX1_BH11MYX1_51080 [soil metagenome]